MKTLPFLHLGHLIDKIETSIPGKSICYFPQDTCLVQKEAITDDYLVKYIDKYLMY